MNYLNLIATFALAGPALAAAAGTTPASAAAPSTTPPAAAAAASPAAATAPATTAPAPTAPAKPTAATPPPEMRAHVMRNGQEVQVPLFSADASSVAVAKVDDDPISLQELMAALARAHQSEHEGVAKQHDFKPVLDRLVNVKLCILEAREMGLDELPEVKAAIEQEEQSQLIGRVRARAIKGVKPSHADVDRFYRDMVREWKLHTLLFDREEAASAFQAALKGGKDFEALAKQAIGDKKAKGSTDVQYVGANGLLPQVLQFVATAKVGESKVLNVNQGWSFVKVLGTRYPENPEVRASAEARALEAAEKRAADGYYKSLEKKYARVDKKLLKNLDFEAPKPGFAALKKDQRPIATIAGEKPLTVADLAAGLEMKFFHGIEGPIKEHRANPAKYSTLDTLLRKRLVLDEARRLEIAKSEDYQRQMAAFRDATLFSAYIERSVMPGVKVSEKEGQEYFAKHKSEFTTPAMYRLESVAFTSAKDAQAALDKLRSGTDFKWLRANATGQVKDSDRSVELDGNVVSANAMTPELRAQLAGTKPGDYRLAEVGGQFYVLRVVSASQPQEQKYVEARAAIGKKLIGQNFEKALDDVSNKLRKAHRVDVYLTRIGY